jgi:hypothetical protein
LTGPAGRISVVAMASSPASPDRDATPWLLVGAAAAVLAVVADVAAIGLTNSYWWVAPGTAVLVVAPAFTSSRLRYWVSDSDAAIGHVRAVEEASVATTTTRRSA